MDAYVSEANQVGTWALIGYKMDQTTNFNYTAPALTAATSISALTGQIGWQAENKVAMNDCGANVCHWTVALNVAGQGDGVSYTAVAGKTAGTTDAAATQLTPTFEKIGK